MEKRWLPVAMVVAAIYVAAGAGTANGSRFSNPHHLAWRLTAWAISAAAYALQIAYEQRRLRSAPFATALHAALAAAVGGFGLAAAAAIRSAHPRAWIVALVAWPLIVAVPAFLIAAGVATLLTMLRTSASPPPSP